MSDGKFILVAMGSKLNDWTGARFIIRSADCPGGIAAIIGGAEEYAFLLAAAPEMLEALKAAITVIDAFWPTDKPENEMEAAEDRAVRNVRKMVRTAITNAEVKRI